MSNGSKSSLSFFVLLFRFGHLSLNRLQPFSFILSLSLSLYCKYMHTSNFKSIQQSNDNYDRIVFLIIISKIQLQPMSLTNINSLFVILHACKVSLICCIHILTSCLTIKQFARFLMILHQEVLCQVVVRTIPLLMLHRLFHHPLNAEN